MLVEWLTFDKCLSLKDRPSCPLWHFLRLYRVHTVNCFQWQLTTSWDCNKYTDRGTMTIRNSCQSFPMFPYPNQSQPAPFQAPPFAYSKVAMTNVTQEGYLCGWPVLSFVMIFYFRRCSPDTQLNPSTVYRVMFSHTIITFIHTITDDIYNVFSIGIVWMNQWHLSIWRGIDIYFLLLGKHIGLDHIGGTHLTCNKFVKHTNYPTFYNPTCRKWQV